MDADGSQGPHPFTLPKKPGLPMQGNDAFAPLNHGPHGIPCAKPKVSQQVAGGWAKRYHRSPIPTTRRTREGCQPSPAPGAGIPAGMPGFTFARVPGSVVASLLNHRLLAGKSPASWQMDADVTWDVATRTHAAVAHPLRRRVGTQPAATCPLGDREPPSSLRADLGGSQGMAHAGCRLPSRGGKDAASTFPRPSWKVAWASCRWT